MSERHTYPAGVPCWIDMDRPDATAARAAELGGSVEVPPFDAGPVRQAMLRDPEGAQFPVGKYDPER